MTVREWLDKNLPKLSDDTAKYRTYSRIMKARHAAQMYAQPDATILNRDVNLYEETTP